MKIESTQKGFTLIELMIVIAIIGILASIAIPQFTSMRIKAYNSASTSDLHQMKLVQESLYSDFRYYGSSLANVTIAAADGAAGAGVMVDGALPLTAGQFNVVAVNSALNAGRLGSAAAIAVSNGVIIRADTTANQQSAIMVLIMHKVTVLMQPILIVRQYIGLKMMYGLVIKHLQRLQSLLQLT
jgi:type IV pilus assembly protein PilA